MNATFLGLVAGDGGEGARFWLQVLTELKNRGVADVCIAVCDGHGVRLTVVQQLRTIWPLVGVHVLGDFL